MTEEKRCVTVDVAVSVPRDLKEAARAYLGALEKIDGLYNLQLGGRVAGAITRARENKEWSEIVRVLGECSDALPESSKAGFEDSLRVLKGGIYDLYPLSAKSGGEDPKEIELILGKVFLSSGGGESYYAGASGVVNAAYTELICGYDAHMELFSKCLGTLSGTPEIKAPEEIPELRCLDVFSLSGGLNTPHKPICVFFSGGLRENVSSLSNMTVFINLYQSRFRAITQKIARRYMPRASDTLCGLSDEDTARLLLIWLRGHDMGHFFGVDNLGSVMSEFDMDYMILHELKSDFIALYNLRHVDSALLGGCTLDQAYAAALAEMLRYIRRGGIYRHPDSGSAYLAYMSLKDRGALAHDRERAMITYDLGRLVEAVEECAAELLELFSSGDPDSARAYVNSWGELQDSDKDGVPRTCPQELWTVIADRDIAHLIDYKFKVD